MAEFYYRLSNGGYTLKTVTGNVDQATVQVLPPENGEEVTPAEYAAGVAAIQVATELRRARVVSEERLQKLGDFNALAALGIPAATAARMAGHVLDQDDEL